MSAPLPTPLALRVVQLSTQLNFTVLIPCFVGFMSSITSMTSFFLLSEFDEAWWALFSSAWSFTLAMTLAKKDVSFAFDWEFLIQLFVYVWAAFLSAIGLIPYIILELYSVAFFCLLSLVWSCILLYSIKHIRDKAASSKKRGGYGADRPIARQRRTIYTVAFLAVKWFFFGVIFLFQTGAVYEVVLRTDDILRYPAQGKLLRINSNKVHMYCVGSGSPVILFDSDYGESHLTWFYLQKKFSNVTTLCSYDRAGYGWSDSGSIPRASRRIAQDLEDLLDTAFEEGIIPKQEYILVSSGISGLFHRYYVTDPVKSEQVKGMLMIHPNHEDQIEYLNKKDNKTPAQSDKERADRRATLDRARVFAPLGVARVAIEMGAYETNAQYLPDKEAEEENAVSCTPQFINVVYHEYRYFENSCNELRERWEDIQLNFPVYIVTAWDEDQATTDVWTELHNTLKGMSNDTTIIAPVKGREQPLALKDADFIGGYLSSLIDKARRNSTGSEPQSY